jgi:glycosyltransferase involved in cell wall biosynthesis
VSAAPRRRLLQVARTRYALPLEPSLTRKFDPLSERIELRVLGTRLPGGKGSDPRFLLYRPARPALLEGLVFHLALPFRTARELRRFRPDVVLVQGAHEAVSVLAARRLARSPAKVVLDVHGDWRAPTRLYGSPLRRLLSPLADRLALAALGRVDAVRTVSAYTTELVRAQGREPIATFPAYMDLEPFLSPPVALPDTPVALFVGALEPSKGIDVLCRAWRQAASAHSGARLRIVGRGSRSELVRRLVAELPAQTDWSEELTSEGVARALDGARFLVLPSRSEGMGRVIVEALCRARPVLASSVGGIRDLVREGENGLLVEPGSVPELERGFERLLARPALVTELGSAARTSAEPWIVSPQRFADEMASLVERCLSPVQ